MIGWMVNISVGYFGNDKWLGWSWIGLLYICLNILSNGLKIIADIKEKIKDYVLEYKDWN